MATEKPRHLLRLEFDRAAQEYLHSLPLEHFMEATSQGTQRAITLASLELLKVNRPDVHLFNELLVQYRRKGRSRIGQVVPDNMVVIHEQEIKAEGSYDLPLQPVGPFWVLEYVSKSSQRKDYDDCFKKYERDLKVPYYLLFYPDNQELSLFHHSGRKYHSVRPNAGERHSIPELEIEVALLNGWIRYWLRGKLLPLPGEMQRSLDAAMVELQRERETREALEREVTLLRARLARLQGQKNGK